jgi:Zinc knuckle
MITSRHWQVTTIQSARVERSALKRGLQFLGNLNPAFYQRRAMLLAQTKIPSLEEAIATMMQEESHMKLHFDANGSVKMRSALVVSNSSMTRVQGETRKCYNCGEVGHLSKVCPEERHRWTWTKCWTKCRPRSWLWRS